MKRRNWIFLLLCAVILVMPSTLMALGEGEFKPLATGGFGDSANSYAWGLTSFNNDLYVSTNRHHLWSLMQSMQGLIGFDIPYEILLQGPADPVWGSADYAAEMAGEIWRLKNGMWEQVYTSPLKEYPQITLPLYGITIPAGQYPQAYGYRTLGTFKGHIYALGVGTWMPPMPFSSIVRSDTGNHGDWAAVAPEFFGNTTNVRGFVEWRDRVYVAASIPGDELAMSGGCVVFSSANGTDWMQVSDIGFGNLDNVEIYYLTTFNDHLYASTVNYVSGFEVWKTDGTEENGKLIWRQVIKEGFGDTWNQYGMTMQAFGQYLYVGTAVGIGMVLKDGQPAGTRALDIIRVDKNDRAELVVGAYFPVDPPPGWPPVRLPLSFMPAGFGNPFNVYTWHMAVYDDWLVVGTLDLSGTLLRGVRALLLSDPGAAMRIIQTIDANGLPFPAQQLGLLKQFDLGDEAHVAALSQLIDFIIDTYGGADLWKSKNGVEWEPVTLSGFDNPLNYGIRRTVVVPDGRGKDQLYIGTANPFTGMPGGGCEVLSTSPVNKSKSAEKKN